MILRSKGGDELVDPPGRDLLVSSAHTFAELANAIDRAFARWDLSHLHEFRLLDGRRVVMEDADEFGAARSDLLRHGDPMPASRFGSTSVRRTVHPVSAVLRCV